MLSIYGQLLSELGIKMTVKELEWADLIERFQNLDFTAYVGGWRMGGDVDFFQLWHSSHANDPKTSNMPGFQDAEGDKLIMAMRKVSIPLERTKIARKFQALIHQRTAIHLYS